MGVFPIFVDNVSSSVQTKDLRKLFSECGRIEEVVILEDNKAFVNFACPDDAIKALRSYRNFPFFGKKLFVTASQELDEFINNRKRDQYMNNKRRHTIDQVQSSNRRHSSDQQRDQYHHHHRRPQEDHHHHRDQRRFSDQRDHQDHHRDQRHSSEQRDQRHSSEQKQRDQQQQHHGYYHGCDVRDRRRQSNSSKHHDSDEYRSSRSKSFDEHERAPAKRKITLENSEEEEKSKKSRSPSGDQNDLREVIQKTKRAKTEEKEDNINENTNDQVMNSDEDEENVEQLKISNLDQHFEESDLEELLIAYGKIVNINTCLKTHKAIVKIKCSYESLQEAIHTLDHSQWMDNECIRVRPIYEIWIWNSDTAATASVSVKEKFKKDMIELFSEYGTVAQAKMHNNFDTILKLKIFCSKEEIIGCLSATNGQKYIELPMKVKFPDDSDNDLELSKEIDNYPAEHFVPKPKTTSNIKKGPSKKKGIRELWLWIPSNLRKNFLNDMEIVVSQYGKIIDKGWKENYVYIQLESSEKQAVKCVAETQNYSYKSEKVRIKFAQDTLEDELFKEETYSIILRNYNKVIIPKEEPWKTVKKNDKLSKFTEKSPSPINDDTNSSSPIPNSSNMAENNPKIKFKIGPISDPRSMRDSSFIASIEGCVYSVSSKLVLISFDIGSSRFARLKPGHMYLDGRKNLGNAIKDLKVQEWSDPIKQMLHIGSQVIMDVRRLSSDEEEEMFELTHEQVMYEVTLVWKTSKPDLILAGKMPSLKGTVVKLWPQWALLQPIINGGDQKLILLTKQNFHTPGIDNVKSLLSYIEIGDTLAVLAKSTDYLPMAEKARALEFFEESIDNIKYEAILAWHLATEIDPYSVIHKRKNHQDSLDFLVSSSRLNVALPNTPDPKYKKWKGYIEELHIPHGGVIRLTDSKAMHLAPVDRQRVYFHRSRLVVNGVKLSNNDILDEEVAVGDHVQVDLIINQIDLTSAYVSQIPNVYWVGLSVKANVAERGTNIANRLRSEGVVPAIYETKVCQGRLVHLKKPDYGDFTNSGLVVLDNGPYAGQRIEIDAEQCYLYGYNLGRTDLSYLFMTNEQVNIMVKPYNSYCLDKLWIGTDIKNNPNDQDGKMLLQKYLFDHGLDKPAFENLLKGLCPSRPFIPLEGQTYKGRIKGFKGQTLAEKIVVEANIGEVLFFEASREDVFVYGHWMGKADLRYIFDEDDEVCFEIHPVYAKNEHQNFDGPQASVVWLGSVNERPKYAGLETTPVINAQIDEKLWEFVKSKKMDEKMFRALVEGRLPPKETKSKFDSKAIVAEVETADGSKIKVDNEVLSQAALLQQMKAQFGSDALMSAMMLLVNQQKSKDAAETTAGDKPSSTSNHE